MNAGGFSVGWIGLWLWLVAAQSSFGGVLFQDGFESGSLSGAWSVSSTGDGRARVLTEFGPASGQHHLVLDDAVDDANYSVSECTLHLDLSHKKNVVVSFKAKSLGNEPNYTGDNTSRAFDGISFSTDGGITWVLVETLQDVPVQWQSYDFTLDYYLSYYSRQYGPDFLIRFSEYDNASAPLDGIAIDDVVITAEEDQRVSFEIASVLQEGGGNYAGFVLLSMPPTNALTIPLLFYPTGLISAPVSVVVPAGQVSATFTFAVSNDTLVNLTRPGSLHTEVAGITSEFAYFRVLDDEMPRVTLTLPAQLYEGVYTNTVATLTLDRAPDVPFSLFLYSTPCCQLRFFDNPTIPAGQTQAVFTIWADDDYIIEGDAPTQLFVRESSTGILLASNQVIIVDAERRRLSMHLPESLLEGGSDFGYVSIPGRMLTNLTVSLGTSNAAGLQVPSTATIVAGETQVAFPITVQDNALFDGTRTVTIFATADSFVGTNQLLIIRDNEIAGYSFSPLSNILDQSESLPISFSAIDIEGRRLSSSLGTPRLDLMLPDGGALPVTLATVTPSPNGWSGLVTLPRTNAGPLRLRVMDDKGRTGYSTSFVLMRSLNLVASDLVWDSLRNRLYASVPSGPGTNSNQIVAIDPVTATITASVSLGQNPGKMVLTSGGEQLYVALQANGYLAQVDPSNLTVTTSSSMGADPFYGTLGVRDMCAVVGHPEQVVVLRAPLIGYGTNSIVAFDGSVPRSNSVAYYSSGTGFLEPSADPGVFFSYDSQSAEQLRRLGLDSSGITPLQSATVFTNYASDIQADGDWLFASSGEIAEGKTLKPGGRFPANGPVRPDLASGRVFFLEPQSPYYWYDHYDFVSAYDPVTLSRVQRLSFAAPMVSPKSFIRWGTNGLAILTSTSVVLFNSSQLVPTGPPADLGVVISAPATVPTNPAIITYAITASNLGPNPAANPIVEVSLAPGQIIQNLVATNGAISGSADLVTLSLDALAVASSTTFFVTVSAPGAGVVGAQAAVHSDAPDSDFSNNTASNLVSVGFTSQVDVPNQLALNANNLIYDPLRHLLWAGIARTDNLSFGPLAVAIDPRTGLISSRIPLKGPPAGHCMAISPNGRYLYVGLEGLPEVSRIDLAANNAVDQIPLGPDSWGNASAATDIEPLAGDGTSFLAITGGDRSAAVYDGAIRRPNRLGAYAIEHVERTTEPSVFVGVNGNSAVRLAVSASGVVITQSVSGLFSYSVDLRGDRDYALTSDGRLLNSSNLTLRANFSSSGRPCLDFAYHRAYLASGNLINAFDTESFLPAGGIPFRNVDYSAAPTDCVRWGIDGLAVLNNDGTISILRWAAAIPADADANANGLPDAWEAAYYNSLEVDPGSDADGDGLSVFQEYLFGTSPVEASANPVQISTATNLNQRALRLVFPRRAHLAANRYEFVSSSNLVAWTSTAGIAESVLSTQNVNGIDFDLVEVLIPATNSVPEFLRWKWNW